MGRIASHRWAFGAALLLVVLAGFAARLTAWEQVLGGGGSQVALKLSDSHYYVRFARIQLHAFPRFILFDPFINHPTGANILWPPLHTWALTLLVALFGEPRADWAAAWLGPGLSVLLLAGTAWVARAWFGAAFGLALSLVLALLPVAVESGALGNADHHVHEPFLMALAAMAVAHAVDDGRARTAVLAGVLMGAGRLFTPLSFVTLPLAAVVIIVTALRSRDGAERASRGALWMAASAAAVAMAGVLLFGRPRSTGYEELSLFHPAFALASLGGAALLAAARVRQWRKAGLALAAAAVGAAPVLIEVIRAGAHLGRADPLLRAVEESLPLYADPGWGIRLFGPLLLLLPLGLAGTVVALRGGNALALSTIVFFVPMALSSLQQVRFTQAAAGPFALVLCVGAVGLWQAALSKPTRMAVAGVVALVAPVAAWSSLQPKRERPASDASVLVRPTLEWMNAHLPQAAKDAYSSGAQPAWGVVSRFDFGHLIALWAERPVVASPFGQAQVHQEGNARASAVLAARTDDEAYQQARRTGARYILASPFGPILGYEDVPREKTWAHRLLEGGGLDTAHFRLLHDSREQRARPGGGTFARVVEVVEGAVIEGRTVAGSSVRLELTLRDNNGQRLQYVRTAMADDEGRFRIRVAHPTDVRRADTVSAEGPYVLYRDGRPDTVEVFESQVQTGATVVAAEPSLATKAEGTAPCPGCRPLEFDAAKRGN